MNSFLFYYLVFTPSIYLMLYLSGAKLVLKWYDGWIGYYYKETGYTHRYITQIGKPMIEGYTKSSVNIYLFLFPFIGMKCKHFYPVNFIDRE